MSAIPAQASADRRAIASGDAIGLLGLFVRLAWEMPEVMDFFPETGEIALREADIHGHAFYLAAIHPDDTGDWVARPSRYAPKPGAVPFQRSIPGSDGDPGDRPGWILATVEAFKAAAPTAAEALDAPEAALRPAIEEAVRIDLDEIVRQRGQIRNAPRIPSAPRTMMSPPPPDQPRTAEPPLNPVLARTLVADRPIPS